MKYSLSFDNLEEKAIPSILGAGSSGADNVSVVSDGMSTVGDVDPESPYVVRPRDADGNIIPNPILIGPDPFDIPYYDRGN